MSAIILYTNSLRQHRWDISAHSFNYKLIYSFSNYSACSYVKNDKTWSWASSTIHNRRFCSKIIPF